MSDEGVLDSIARSVRGLMGGAPAPAKISPGNDLAEVLDAQPALVAEASSRAAPPHLSVAASTGDVTMEGFGAPTLHRRGRSACSSLARIPNGTPPSPSIDHRWAPSCARPALLQEYWRHPQPSSATTPCCRSEQRLPLIAMPF